MSIFTTNDLYMRLKVWQSTCLPSRAVTVGPQESRKCLCLEGVTRSNCVITRDSAWHTHCVWNCVSRRVSTWQCVSRTITCFTGPAADCTDWSQLYKTDTDINIAADTFVSYLNFCIDECVPTKLVKYLSRDKDWVTTEVRVCLRAEILLLIKIEMIIWDLNLRHKML